jgi:hypothetical protein
LKGAFIRTRSCPSLSDLALEETDVAALTAGLDAVRKDHQ